MELQPLETHAVSVMGVESPRAVWSATPRTKTDKIVAKMMRAEIDMLSPFGAGPIPDWGPIPLHTNLNQRAVNESIVLGVRFVSSDLPGITRH